MCRTQGKVFIGNWNSIWLHSHTHTQQFITSNGWGSSYNMTVALNMSSNMDERHFAWFHGPLMYFLLKHCNAARSFPNYSISISFSFHFPICMSFCYLFRRASIALYHFISFISYISLFVFIWNMVAQFYFLFVGWFALSLLLSMSQSNSIHMWHVWSGKCMQNYQFVIVSILQLKQSDREKKNNFKSTHNNTRIEPRKCKIHVDKNIK